MLFYESFNLSFDLSTTFFFSSDAFSIFLEPINFMASYAFFMFSNWNLVGGGSSRAFLNKLFMVSLAPLSVSMTFEMAWYFISFLSLSAILSCFKSSLSAFYFIYSSFFSIVKILGSLFGTPIFSNYNASWASFLLSSWHLTMSLASFMTDSGIYFKKYLRDLGSILFNSPINDFA